MNTFSLGWDLFLDSRLKQYLMKETEESEVKSHFFKYLIEHLPPRADVLYQEELPIPTVTTDELADKSPMSLHPCMFAWSDSAMTNR